MKQPSWKKLTRKPANPFLPPSGVETRSALGSGGGEEKAVRERPGSARRAIARNKAPRFVADIVANGCAVTGPHSTEPRMRDATHSIVFYILPGRFSPPRYS